MNRKLLLLAGALVTALLSCQQRQEEPSPQALSPQDPRTKVVQLGDEYSTSSFLVKFHQAPTQEQLEACSVEGVLSLERVFPPFPGKEVQEREFGLDRWYEAHLEEGANLDFSLLAMAALEQVAVVEYNHLARQDYVGEIIPAQEVYATKATAGGTFNDPMLMDQWHYNNQGSYAYSTSAVKGADVNVNDVWQRLTCGDPSIIVAVVDEGVKHTHPDLQANMWVNTKEIAGNGIDDDGNGYVDDVYGYNFVGAGGPIEWSASGNSGHGTHCAGTIAAVNNNGKGVSGIAGGTGAGDGCRIMSCQIFSGSAGASVPGVGRAIKYAADMGASLISCSFGYKYAFASDNAYISRQGTAEIDAIHYFEAQNNTGGVLDGNIAIFAAGNDEHNYAHYPGAFVDIISVSAFAPDYLPSYYTNYGPGCNIAAPGGEYYHGVGSKSAVLSTLTTEGRSAADYGYMQGTSMACPHVTGVVALGLSYAKQLGKKFTRDEFKQMILSSTNDIDQRIGSKKEKTYQGRGALAMAPYYHQMGTGAIDAWRLMMNIEGTPSVTAQLGQSQWISLEGVFGSSSVSLTYLAVDIPQSTIDALGLQKIKGTSQDKYPCIPTGECYGYIQFGRLYIHPTKLGSGKIVIRAVGGGDHVGGGDIPPGGMELDRELSIIARDVPGGNGTGGWL